MSKHPIFKIHSRALCRDGESSAFLRHPDDGYIGNVLSATLRDGKIRLDVYGSGKEEIDVLVNIDAEQSLHPAIIVKPNQLEVLQHFVDGTYHDLGIHRGPKFRHAHKYEYHIVNELQEMGLVGTEEPAYIWPQKDGDILYDLSSVTITQAGKHILSKVKAK